MIELEDIETIEDISIKDMPIIIEYVPMEDIPIEELEIYLIKCDKKLRKIVRAMVRQMDDEIAYLQDSISLFEKEKTIASLKDKLTELRKQRRNNYA